MLRQSRALFGEFLSQRASAPWPSLKRRALGLYFPGDDPRPGQQARLLRLLQNQGVEISRADKAFRSGRPNIRRKLRRPHGPAVLPMADMLLDKQYFNVKDPSPTMMWLDFRPAVQRQTVRVDDVSVLTAPMTLVKGEVRAAGGLIRLGAGPAKAYVINNNATARSLRSSSGPEIFPAGGTSRSRSRKKPSKRRAESSMPEAIFAGRTPRTRPIIWRILCRVGSGGSRNRRLRNSGASRRSPSRPGSAAHRRDAHLAEYPERRLGENHSR